MAHLAWELAVVAAAFGLVGPGCAANGTAGAGQEVGAEEALPPTASALVIGPDELRRQAGQSVLDAMEAGLPGVRVATTLPCPTLILRGPSAVPDAPPTVYVDGTPATDTCILEDLTADEIGRVEVYPAGFTPRPGYAANPSGLVLLFTRRGASEPGPATAIRR